MSSYVATLLIVAVALRAMHVTLPQWCGMLAAVCATLLTIWLEERGRWTLGLRASPPAIVRDIIVGSSAAAVLTLAVDAGVRSHLGIVYVRGAGFPWLSMIGTFMPAVIHEELLFRGYAYQKLRTRGVAVAIACSSVVFMLLHLHNAGVTRLAALNILFGGVLLALAYELHQRMWLPFAFHLIWNVTAGLILGWPVGGYVTPRSLITVRSSMPETWWSGGTFGLQGSVLTTVAEALAIVVLLVLLHRRRRA